jgi:hypothetical protein
MYITFGFIAYALGVSILYAIVFSPLSGLLGFVGCFLAVFAGWGMRGAFSGNYRQKIVGLIACAVTLSIALGAIMLANNFSDGPDYQITIIPKIINLSGLDIILVGFIFALLSPNMATLN